MTEPAWTPRALPVPETRAPSRWRGWVLPILGCLPISLAAMLCLLELPTEVRSEADLASVGFGWPFAWMVQDQSRYASQHFPMTAEYVGARGMVDPLTTQVDWAAFAADTAILWVAACAVLGLALRILQGVRSARATRAAALQ